MAFIEYGSSFLQRTPPPTFRYEEKHWTQGRRCVVGVDEVGRGALAGPVVAAACLLEPRVEIEVSRHDSIRFPIRVLSFIGTARFKAPHSTTDSTYLRCSDEEVDDLLRVRFRDDITLSVTFFIAAVRSITTKSIVSISDKRH